MARGQRPFFSPGRPIPSAGKHRPPGAPLGVLLGLFLPKVGARSMTVGGAIFSGWARELSGSVRRKVAGSFSGRSLRGPLERKRETAGLRGAKLRPVIVRSRPSLVRVENLFKALRDASHRAASASSERRRRAPGGAPEDEFLCKRFRRRSASRAIATRLESPVYAVPLGSQPGFCRASKGWAQGRIFFEGRAASREIATQRVGREKRALVLPLSPTYCCHWRLA